MEMLEHHPVFVLCSIPEKEFLRGYLASHGDMTASIKKAWPKVTNIQNMARQLQKRDTVAALLDIIDGAETPTKSALVQLLWKTMRTTSNDYVVLRGAEQISDLEGYGIKPTPDAEEVQKIKNELARRIDNVSNANN
jgi:hypothetical protein